MIVLCKEKLLKTTNASLQHLQIRRLEIDYLHLFQKKKKRILHGPTKLCWLSPWTDVNRTKKSLCHSD